MPDVYLVQLRVHADAGERTDEQPNAAHRDTTAAVSNLVIHKLHNIVFDNCYIHQSTSCILKDSFGY